MSTNREALHLAELLCARLCHDLAGPLGALIGIIEIAREEHPDSESIALAEQTAVELGQRLKLLRAAWGRDSEALDRAGLAGLVTGLPNRRVEVDLRGLGETNGVFPPGQARLVLNLLLLASESLPGGGIVALSGSPAGNLLVTLSGPRAAWPRGLAGHLIGDTTALGDAVADPRSVQGPLTALLARGLGYRLSMLMPAGAGSGGDEVPPLLLAPGR